MQVLECDHARAGEPHLGRDSHNLLHEKAVQEKEEENNSMFEKSVHEQPKYSETSLGPERNTQENQHEVAMMKFKDMKANSAPDRCNVDVPVENNIWALTEEMKEEWGKRRRDSEEVFRPRPAPLARSQRRHLDFDQALRSSGIQAWLRQSIGEERRSISTSNCLWMCRTWVCETLRSS